MNLVLLRIVLTLVFRSSIPSGKVTAFSTFTPLSSLTRTGSTRSTADDVVDASLPWLEDGRRDSVRLEGPAGSIELSES
jgi:hypothetical protein